MDSVNPKDEQASIFEETSQWYRFAPGMFGLPCYTLGIGVQQLDSTTLRELGFEPFPTVKGKWPVPQPAQTLLMLGDDDRSVALGEISGNDLVVVGAVEFEEPVPLWSRMVRRQQSVIVLVAPTHVFVNDYGHDDLETFKNLLASTYRAQLPVVLV